VTDLNELSDAEKRLSSKYKTIEVFADLLKLGVEFNEVLTK
jgi:hypothetical protein